ncbi:hypothetical protein [Thermococcus sp.]
MKRRDYLAALFLGFVVLGLVSPAVSAGIPGSVTLKIQQKTWYAEADVYTTIFYYVTVNNYGIAKFYPLGDPYNYIHFGSHSGTSSNAYWKSSDASITTYSIIADGFWHLDALWDSREGTMKLSVAIAYKDSSRSFDTKNFGTESMGTPYLLVRVTVDDSGGNELANKVEEVAIGEIENYLVSA